MASFCEGCPFANGVNEIDESVFITNFTCGIGEGYSGFDIALKDAKDPNVVSNSVRATYGSSADSSMPSATFNHIIRKVDNCSGLE